MAISVASLVDDGTRSVREQALNQHLSTDGETPYTPFSLRELVTPQYQVTSVLRSWQRYKVAVASSTEYWENWVAQHSGQRTEYRPTSRPELLAAVGELARSKGKVRAVGSGHSHSNAPAPPEDQYIELNPGDPGDTGSTGLNSAEIDNEGWLKSDAELGRIQKERRTEHREKGHGPRERHPLDREHLKRIEAGVMLRRLNRHVLHPAGYALKNMGSFDGQTIAGAVNTSTHGTGIGLASIADSVESVEIATVPESASGDPIVRLYRIEPSDGITDREAFEADTADHEMELIQDDDLFYSTVVGYGCMGVVYAYTLHVRDSYWLREEAELMSWDTLREELSVGGDGETITEASVREFLTESTEIDGTKVDCRHTQFLVNVAADQVPAGKVQTNENHGIGQHEGHRNPLCLVRRHYPVASKDEPSNWEKQVEPRDPHDPRWPPERRKKTARDIAKALGHINPLAPNRGKARQMHRRLFHPEYRRDPFVENREESAWYVALRRLRDRGGPNASEHRHPEPPKPPTITTEVAVPLEAVADAAEAIRKRIRQPDPITQDRIEGKTWHADGRPVFFAIPMGIRFTAASEHHLSPEYDRATAMLEVPMPVNPLDANVAHQTPKLSVDEIREEVAEPALSELHNHVVFTGGPNPPVQFDARPHMGKHNTVGEGWLDANYEYYDASGDSGVEVGWLQAYDRFNAFGTFDNEFTSQFGIDNG